MEIEQVGNSFTVENAGNRLAVESVSTQLQVEMVDVKTITFFLYTLQTSSVLEEITYEPNN